MELKDEIAQIRQQGMERAAVLWETLENLPQPISPVDIYKAACSLKCAEFMTRIRRNPLFLTIMKSIGEFLDGTAAVVGDAGDRDEGLRAVSVIEEAMPMTPEVFEDATACATRQHVFDGVIMLASAKMGRDKETKECLDRLQEGIAKAMIEAMIVSKFREALRDLENE